MKEFKIKSDKYLQQRGGTAKFINIICSKCNNLIFVYQKDGPGWLKRCYINRIVFPEKYASLKKIRELVSTIQLGNLVCSCGNLIGTPMTYKDKRLAYHLIRGNFTRKTHK